MRQEERLRNLTETLRSIEDKDEAASLLESAGQDVKTAIVMRSCRVDQKKAREALEKNEGFVRRAQAWLAGEQ